MGPRNLSALDVYISEFRKHCFLVVMMIVVSAAVAAVAVLAVVAALACCLLLVACGLWLVACGMRQVCLSRFYSHARFATTLGLASAFQPAPAKKQCSRFSAAWLQKGLLTSPFRQGMPAALVGRCFSPPWPYGCSGCCSGLSSRPQGTQP